ncbi:Molybdopterin synthase catalytic subunit [Orchesella cincta]|uniref:Molybdopterin synthase catalytic subunit n=1 Tax=Orchesella cincta TaxID=48709 RepID=A0A1D2N839_ORCCI|nr:Molybdopterin synthase catalytic subunit [Orchesella cincta]
MDHIVSVRVLFFAGAKDKIGQHEGSIIIPNTIPSAREILNIIINTYPVLRPFEHCVVLTRNHVYLDLTVDDPVNLTENDELAVIPPLSADSEEILNLVTSPKCGAISTFIGITRDNFEDKKVLKLEYEAYEPMAILEMKKICCTIREKWPVEHIAIYHRLGVVPVSEASVYVAISSEHRQESLDAVSFTINALKATVPIWKKEIYESKGGDETVPDAVWKANSECFWSQNNRKLDANDASAADGC